MSETKVIVGAGPVGRHTAESAGDGATGWSWSPGPAGARDPRRDPGGRRRRRPDALDRRCDRGPALFNCANPTDYTTWDRVWPPLAESLLLAAERTGATLVTALLPLRLRPDDRADGGGAARSGHRPQGSAARRHVGRGQGRHEAGRITAVEVRGSDYVGDGVGANGHVSRHLPTVLRGRAPG